MSVLGQAPDLKDSDGVSASPLAPPFYPDLTLLTTPLSSRHDFTPSHLFTSDVVNFSFFPLSNLAPSPSPRPWPTRRMTMTSSLICKWAPTQLGATGALSSHALTLYSYENDEGENAPAVGKVAPDASAADHAAVKPEPEADSMPAIAAGSTGGADSGYSPNQQEMKQDPGMEGVEGGEPDTWANTPPEERAIGMKEDG